MNHDPENFNLLYSRLIISQMVKYGIKYFIISPGLRNAPLMNALKVTQDINVSVSLDERAAGYMALGQYKATGIPSVLICTSGTAVANYFPSILEAQKTNSPIIVISADRPQELHYESSNQTMDQLNLFKTLQKKTLNVPIQDKGINLQSCYTQVERYIQSAIRGEVIHLNFPFSEPLDNSYEKIGLPYLQDFHQLQVSLQSKVIKQKLTDFSLDLDMFKNKNGLLVVGELNTFLDRDKKNDFVQFIKNCPWPKIIDITTSVKYQFCVEDNNFPSFDHPEVFQAFKDNTPEMIVHLGGKLTSKKYHEYIYHSNVSIINVSNDKNSEKALSRVTQYISIEPHEFAEYCLKNESIFSLKEISYLTRIKNYIGPLISKKIEIINDAPLTCPKISKFIVEQIPESTDLYISNSTAIRSFDSYSSFNLKKDVNIQTHRGVSGIEGFLAASSAFHNSKTPPTPTVLVIGDISFLHDLNSLNLIQSSTNPFIIILINNNGGGIFTLVPYKDDHNIMPWMTTPHEYQFDKISASFGIKHQFIYDHTDFCHEFSKALTTPCTQILELKIDNLKNLDIYQKLKTVRL
jgi:2-succinyl-5-enolpyruvyl-6-hydroxy-3-cyclohexene-1-carboxylate synthase